MNKFTEAVTAFKPFMYRISKRLGCTNEEAHDSVQKALEQLWLIRDRIDYMGPNRVKGLFCRAAQMRATDLLRHKNFEGTGFILNSRTLHQEDIDTMLMVHKALNNIDPIEAFVAWNYWGLGFSLAETIEELEKYKHIKWTKQNLHQFITKRVRPHLRRALIAVGAH